MQLTGSDPFFPVRAACSVQVVKPAVAATMSVPAFIDITEEDQVRGVAGSGGTQASGAGRGGGRVGGDAAEPAGGSCSAPPALALGPAGRARGLFNCPDGRAYGGGWLLSSARVS